jgi:hypothetical protein
MFPMAVIDQNRLFLATQFDNDCAHGIYLNFNEIENAYIPSKTLSNVSLKTFKHGFDYLTTSDKLKKYEAKNVIMNPYIEDMIHTQKIIYH